MLVLVLALVLVVVVVVCVVAGAAVAYVQGCVQHDAGRRRGDANKLPRGCDLLPHCHRRHHRRWHHQRAQQQLQPSPGNQSVEHQRDGEVEV
jgi:hypothetical protein